MGTYLLRTNCQEHNPRTRWRWYIHFTEVEAAYTPQAHPKWSGEKLTSTDQCLRKYNDFAPVTVELRLA